MIWILQIVKIDGLYKTVLGKTGLVVTFKVCNIHIQPDGRTEIKLMADFVQRVKNFMGTGIVTRRPRCRCLSAYDYF